MKPDEKYEKELLLVVRALTAHFLEWGSKFTFETDDIKGLERKDVLGKIRYLSNLGALKYDTGEVYQIAKSPMDVEFAHYGDPTPRVIAVEINEQLLGDIASKLENKYSKGAGTAKSDNRLARLIFNEDDGLTDYRGAVYQFKTGKKAHALLALLKKNKNTPFTTEDIKEHCNEHIGIGDHRFREEKDIRDTVNAIRKNLKVNNGEFFPLTKRDGKWVWQEK